jgi:hypothetical protein
LAKSAARIEGAKNFRIHYKYLTNLNKDNKAAIEAEIN